MFMSTIKRTSIAIVIALAIGAAALYEIGQNHKLRLQNDQLQQRPPVADTSRDATPPRSRIKSDS